MGKLRKRQSFSHIDEILDMPDLIEVQKNSYRRFLEVDMREVLDDVSPIVDYTENLSLEFVDYSLDEPKNSVERCKERDMTYAAPLKVKVRLRNKETEEIKEQEIFMGDFPIMTQAGTFVINGAERVIVSQIVRSPGIYYSRTEDKSGAITYATTVIPYRGAWLEYETDLSNVFYVRIDKNRKLPITCLIRAVVPRPTRRSSRCSARTSASWPPWRRTPARPMRTLCWRSTAGGPCASSTESGVIFWRSDHVLCRRKSKRNCAASRWGASVHPGGGLRRAALLQHLQPWRDSDHYRE